jgi:NitT/TauT family transport system substrate-binding protein
MSKSVKSSTTRRSFLASTGAGIALLIQSPAVLRAQANKKINMAIHWIPRGDFAAYYLARERGYYAQAGLDITFQHVLGNGPALQAIAAGTAQFCHADLTQMLQLQGKNPESRMRSLVIAADRTGTTLFFRKGKGINTPKDLEGRSIVDSAGSTARALFTLVEKANKIDSSKVTWKTAAANAKAALMVQGEADAVATGLWSRVGLLKSMKEEELGQFPFGDFGADIHGDSVIASEAFVNDNRDLVRGFVKATIRGFKEGFAEPAAAVEAIRKQHIELVKENAIAEFEITKDLALGAPQKAHGIGYHDPEKMKTTYDAVVNLIGQPIARSVADFFSNDYLA